MTQTTDTYQLLRAFVDELARCGMRAACTSPGSRSAPLVLSLAAEERLRCYSHIDERCAGFFALGLAKASGLPVAVACTSGTAAAQLAAAAIEAHEARVPLLLLTADRPAELRDNGAGQAIDQIKLYGASAKWFVEVSVHEAGPDQLRWMRTLACRAYATALEDRPGAVHLNFPLYEPLTLDPGTSLPEDESGRADGQPFVRRSRSPMLPNERELELLAERVSAAQRGVIVAGRHERPTPLAESACGFAEAAGWPLLADPMSGARRGTSAVAHYDALLRDDRLAGELKADLVLRVGDLPVSKPLRAWLAAHVGTAQIALDPEGAWQDPAGLLSANPAFEPSGTLDLLTARLDGTPSDWLAGWREADETAARALADAIDYSTLSEPAVARALGEMLPAGATLFVASSMPVRDIETFWPVRADPPRVLCNRGANGIDGIVSSAFGTAAAGDGPSVLLIGDVALAHDIGGLLAAKRLGLKLTVVLLDNGGGGIFDFLPVSSAAEDAVYTQHVATPTGLDFSHAATLYRLGHERADDLDGFQAALTRALASERSSIVEVRGERSANVALHRRAWGEVSKALSSAGQ
jgi:2-succinyl-5-enolpyruvyl-6-hydroxy-3-cyclohexene-1-carboxylate synthase